MKILWIAQLIYEEPNKLPDKVPFFDHWEDAAPPIPPEISPQFPISQLVK